ncbi:MAG TPA: nuclear transport factor 2 family protein [candidate division Zixibacteria bacterium]|nr:nuclear transport factor 2 family protein [candidate division Zixibacteria bacterium]
MKTFSIMLTALFLAFPAWAEAGDQDDIKAAIDKFWADAAAKTPDPSGDNPAGVWQAGSNGSLWNFLSPAERAAQTTSSPYTNNFQPKHITVRIMGSDQDVAHAVYYLVGTISRDGETVITNYRTRVSQVYEKIDGKWLLSGAHYSALHGGSGVPQDAFSSQNKR